MKTAFPIQLPQQFQNPPKFPKNFQVPSIPCPPLFITNLDPTITQGLLYTFFLQFGPLEFVAVTEESQTANSSKCAYVKYFNYPNAEAAYIRAQYHKFGDKHIKIRFQRDIRDFLFETTLFIKNLPPAAALWDVMEHFGNTGFEVSGVNIDRSSEGLTFGCGYVQFEKKEEAEIAFNEFQGKELMGNKLELISFFPRNFKTKPNIKENIRISRLPEGLDEEELKAILTETLSVYGEIQKITIEEEIEGDGHYGVIYFKENEDAQAAYNDLVENVREYSEGKGQVLVVKDDKENTEKQQGESEREEKNGNNNYRQDSGTDEDEDPFYEVNTKNNGPPRGNNRGFGETRNGEIDKQQEKKSQSKTVVKMQKLYFPKGKNTESWLDRVNSNKENPRVSKNEEQSAPRPLVLQKRAEKEEEIEWIAESYIEMPLKEFLKLKKDKQKERLAKLLFPRIRGVTGDRYAPKVTGMLADLSKYKAIDIIEFIHEPELLKEKVNEAVEEIEKGGYK